MNLLKSLFLRKNDSKIRRRIPLFVRIFATLLSVLVLFVFVLGGAFYDRYNDTLNQSVINKGRLTLAHLSLTSKMILLEGDLSRLNLLASDYTHDEAVSYISVVDHNQTILAHTDSTRVGEKYSDGPETVADTNQHEGTVYALSQPLSFQDKFLGTVYVGLSQRYINNYVDVESSTLLKSFFLPLLILLLLIFSLSIFLTAWIKLPLYKILTAIQGICRGDFSFQLDVSGNNEFGDLAAEIRQLSNYLRVEEQTRTDVADFLNCTTLERILETSQSNGSSYASRRQVTILYAGIIGFGEYASHTKAEEVVEALNEYIGIATNTILAHGGYVDKFMGDAVVGIFGVSVYREDHTRRAVRAAWELQKVLSEHDKGRNQLFSKIRIGMSSGVVLSGNIGSASRVEYSSIGESIKEAIGLNGLAEAKEIIISKSIYQIIKDVACVEALTPQNLVGHEGVLESYRLQSFDESPQTDGQVALMLKS